MSLKKWYLHCSDPPYKVVGCLSSVQALRTYEEVTGCYNTIFRSIELPVEVAEADSGNIGGKLSHEYVRKLNLCPF